MTPPCPICHAEHCPEERPDCRERAEQRRALYASANGPGEPRTYIVPPELLARVERLLRRAARPRRGGAR